MRRAVDQRVHRLSRPPSQVNHQHDHKDAERHRTTALIATARTGFDGVARLLLMANADMHIAKADGNTALLVALARGNEAFARVLIDHSADVETLLSFSSNEGFTPLHAAAAGNVLSMVQDVLRTGTLDVNQPVSSASFEGFTALHYAAEKGHTLVIKALLRAHADLQARTGASRGAKTPLDLAREAERADELCCLLQPTEVPLPLGAGTPSAVGAARAATAGGAAMAAPVEIV